MKGKPSFGATISFPKEGTQEHKAMVALVLRVAGLPPEEEALWRATGSPAMHLVTLPEVECGPDFLWLVRPRAGAWTFAALAEDGGEVPSILPIIADTISRVCSIPHKPSSAPSLRGTIAEHCAALPAPL